MNNMHKFQFSGQNSDAPDECRVLQQYESYQTGMSICTDILHQSESKSCKVHVKELVVAKEETSLE
jgi:hypothetical protein